MIENVIKICSTMLDEYYSANDNLEKKRRYNYLYAFIYAKLNTLSINEKVIFIDFLMKDKNATKIYENLINSENKNLANTNEFITLKISKSDFDMLMNLFSKLQRGY